MSTMVQLAEQKLKNMTGKPTIRQRRHKADALSVQIARYSRRSLPKVIIKPQVSAHGNKDVDEDEKVKRNSVSHTTGKKEVFVYKLWLGHVLPSTRMRFARSLARSPPTITNLPTEILAKVFNELEPPSQICLALVNKTLANASCHVNRGSGIYYSRGERMRLLWRLSTWMSEGRGICYSCEIYYPTSPGVWKKRKDIGRSRTRNTLYGRIPEDFIFKYGTCPECAAEKTWKCLIKSKRRLQSALA